MSITLELRNKKYNSLKKQLNYYNLSDYSKIIVYGEKSQKLINTLSIRNIDNIKTRSFFTILMNKNKFIDEVIIISLSKLKYLIISQSPITYKILNRLSKTQFPSTSVSLINNLFIYSLHGDLSIVDESKNIFSVSHQGYNYKIFLSENIKLLETKYPNIFKLSVDYYKLFLYNNNVIINVNIKNKRLRLNVIKAVYSADNCKFKCKPLLISIKQFESTLNFIPVKNSIIYDVNNNKIGILYNYFRLRNKKYPFIIAIIKKYSLFKYVYIIDKLSKNKIILKYRPIYN